ncbi:MAG: hypothetical protein ACR2OY_12435 [Boseongicola sp.]
MFAGRSATPGIDVPSRAADLRGDNEVTARYEIVGLVSVFSSIAITGMRLLLADGISAEGAGIRRAGSLTVDSRLSAGRFAISTMYSLCPVDANDRISAAECTAL